MPGIDFSTLSGADLQRLLKIARARNDGPLVDQLEWEVASRGSGPASAPSRGAAPFPRMGEDDEDDPGDQNLGIRLDDPEPFVLPGRSAEPPRRRGLALVGLGVLLGAGFAGAAFWGMSQMAPAPTQRLMALQAAAPPAPPPIGAAPAATAPALEVPPEPAAEATTAEPIPSPDVKAEPAAPSVRPAKTTETPRRNPAGDACARATGADRLVCKDPSLRQADAALREAYIRALNANADPEVLDARQAAWRRERDEVSSPEDLARLYRERTRELDAATAAARAKLGPG